MKRRLLHRRRALPSSSSQSWSPAALAAAAAPVSRRLLVETLEARALMSVTLDADGWTRVTPSADSRVIYVSLSTGNDANDGLTPATAKRTIGPAQSLLRSGFPDQLLLKRGDVWDYTFGVFSKSGRNAQEPMVIGAYGEGARPMIRTGNEGVIDTNGRAVHDLYIMGVHLYAHGRDVDSTSFVSTDGEKGFRIVGKTNRFLLEDSVIDGFAMNVYVDQWNGRATDIRIRRNTIANSYAAPGDTSSGIYLAGVDGALIEGNVIDHNGWHPTLAGMNAYGHNVYLQGDTTGVRVIDNIIANGGSHGLQARSGGIVSGNTFVRNPIHMSFGMVNGGPVMAGGVKGEVSHNVFLEGRRFANPTSNRGEGWALELGNTRPGGGTSVHDNVFAHNTGGANYAIRLDVPTNLDNPEGSVGLNDLTIENNTVYRWYGGLYTSSKFVNGGTGNAAYNNVTVRNNDVQNLGSGRIVSYGGAFDTAQAHWSGNEYHDADPASGWFSVAGATTSLASWTSRYEPTAAQQQLDYIDPNRTTATYSAANGGDASHTAFMARAMASHRLAYDELYTARAFNDYVRNGMMEAVQPPPPPDPLPPTDTIAPTAALAPVAAVTAAGGASQTLRVTYSDASGIDVATLGPGDLRVTGPGGYEQPAALVSAAEDASGTVVAVYTVAAPGGTWDAADSGAYAVALAPGAVADNAGLVTPAATLGSFDVAIAPPAPPADTTPPTVVRAAFVRTAPHKVTVTFSEDVSATLSTADLVLTRNGSSISRSRIAVTYDRATNTATFTFPGYKRGKLPSGRYVFTLLHAEIRDAARNRLDGNANGIPGPDYVFQFTV